MILIRPAVIPSDVAGIAALDTSFTTELVYAAEAGPEGVRLTIERAPAPILKRFPLDDLNGERAWSEAWVADDGDRIVGFAAASYLAWNRRVLLWHFYVDPARRGQGLGRRLIDAVDAYGRMAGARRLWLETSNLNVAGVEIYRRLGFDLCGVDLSLYEGTAAEGEFALFLHKTLT